MFQGFLQTFRTIKLGVRNVRSHKLRSGLTVLGIVFGVCSVISMLAIGEGASRDILERLKSLGTQNIILRSIKPPDDPSARTNRGGAMARYVNAVDYGIRYADAARLEAILPSVEVHVPIKAIQTAARYQAQEESVTMLGTVPWYPRTANLTVTAGRFLTQLDMERRENVCVIGRDTARALFFYHDPIGKRINVGSNPYTVVGVIEDIASAGVEGLEDLPSQSADVFVPLTTLRDLEGDLFRQTESGSTQTEYVELHQLTLRIKSIDQVMTTNSYVVKDMLRHHPQGDVEVIAPFALLENAKSTQRVFTIVLGSIAAISLLVGGIGIMNIMLASVSERTREIGIRRALGARQTDIMMQFLVECMILSVGGGVIGMALGAGIPTMVTRFTGMPTVLSSDAFVLAFGVSVAIGLVFGLYPARRAAMMDPIEALRHE